MKNKSHGSFEIPAPFCVRWDAARLMSQFFKTSHSDHVTLSFCFYLTSDSCLSSLTSMSETSYAANQKTRAWPSATKFQTIVTCTWCATILQRPSQTARPQTNRVSTGTSITRSVGMNRQIPSREPSPSTTLGLRGLQFFRLGSKASQSVCLSGIFVMYASGTCSSSFMLFFFSLLSNISQILCASFFHIMIIICHSFYCIFYLIRSSICIFSV